VKKGRRSERPGSDYEKLKIALRCGLTKYQQYTPIRTETVVDGVKRISGWFYKIGCDDEAVLSYLNKLSESGIKSIRPFCFILADIIEWYHLASEKRFQFSRDNMKKVKKLLELTRWFNKNYTYEHVIMKRPLSVRHVMCDAEDVLEDVMKTAQQRNQMPKISWNESRDMNIACLVSCLVVDCGKSHQEAIDTLAFLYEQHPCNSDRRVLKSSTIKTIVKREFERLQI